MWVHLHISTCASCTALSKFESDARNAPFSDRCICFRKGVAPRHCSLQELKGLAALLPEFLGQNSLAWLADLPTSSVDLKFGLTSGERFA